MRLNFRRWKIFAGVLIGLAVFLLVIGAILPLVVEDRLTDLLDELARSGKFTVEVKRFGLYGADVALRAAHRVDAAPSGVENLTLRYTPGGLLWHRRLDEVALRGVTIVMNVSGQGAVLPVAQMFPVSGEKSSGSSGFDFRRLPIRVGRISGDGVVRIEFPATPPATGRELLFLPFTGSISCDKSGWSKFFYCFDVALPGGGLRVAGGAEDEQFFGSLEGELGGEESPLWVRAQLPAECRPAIRIESDFQLGIPQWKLTAARLNLKLLRRSKLPGNLSIVDEPEIRATLKDGKVDFSISGGKLLREKLELPLPQIAGDGDLATGIGAGKIEFGSAFNCGELPFAFDLSQKRFELGYPEKTAQDKWSWETLSGDLSGTLPGGRIVLDGAAGTLSGTWSMASVKTPFLAVKLPELSVSGALSAPTISCSGGEVTLPAAQLKLADIAAQVPLFSPVPGRISVGKIEFSEQNLGEIAAETHWGDRSVTLQATAQLAGVRAQLAALADWQNAFRLTGKAEAPRQKFTPAAELLTLLPPDYADLEVSGEVRARGDFQLIGGVFSGSAGVEIAETHLSLPAKNWEISDLAVNFQLPELPKLGSAARQTVRCGKVKVGAIETGAAEAQLRMDSPTAWNLEKLRINWCGGVIRSEYFHFDPRSEVFPLTIHCDRLNLAEFLAQIGAGAGAGSGKISGTLPVEYSHAQGIRVEDAFLYTSPGETGHLELAFSEAVRAAQGDNPVFDMAQAALREFDYSWAKINLATAGEELKLTMQLNGKPVKPLYFTYADGGIVKSDVPHNFQGIMLDVNLALPVQDILELVKPF